MTRAVITIKQKIQSLPLSLPDQESAFILETDASDKILAAVLLQNMANKKRFVPIPLEVFQTLNLNILHFIMKF